MKSKSSYNKPIFVPYDDENFDHVSAGPDYGQPQSRSAWSEMDSVEYPDFVEEIGQNIINNKIRISS